MSKDLAVQNKLKT